MTSFPITGGVMLPNQAAAMYLRALADQAANIGITKVYDAETEDWVAVEAALEALSDALNWIEGPL